MRIALVTPYDLSEEGGVKRHVLHLASALRALGDEVDLLGPTRRPVDLEHAYTFRGVVNVPSNGSANHIGIFTCPHQVRRVFEDRRYDVVHIHEPLTPSLNYWALWSAGAAARVGTFHAFSEHESASALATRRVFSYLAYRSYDRGIAVSPAAARHAAATFAKPLAIIPNGITTRTYRDLAARPPRPLGTPLRLLFVGHWRDSRKGLRYLLDACERLATLGVAYTLDVVGDGGSNARREVPHVRYHGAISEEAVVAALYAECDVFVAPSIGMESFGIVLLEAMAAGRPIACSDIEGYRAVVGDGAVLVPPADADALVRAISRLAAEPALRAQLGSAGQERARAFEWSELAGRVRAEYVAAIAMRHGDLAARAHVVAHARSSHVR